MRVEIVATQFSHIKELCNYMREYERKNFEKLGQEPEKLVIQEVAKSLHSWTGLVDKRVVAIIGIRCSGVLSDEGYVWMIVSSLAEQYPSTFLRRGKEHLELMQQMFKKIYGFVMDDFACSIKWLGWLGFTVADPVDGVRRFEWTQAP